MKKAKLPRNVAIETFIIGVRHFLQRDKGLQTLDEEDIRWDKLSHPLPEFMENLMFLIREECEVSVPEPAKPAETSPVRRTDPDRGSLMLTESIVPGLPG